MSNVETEIKRLRNEVQELSDQLAIMKRKYEDIIYNIGDENFSGKFIREKENMKTAIQVTSEGIKTKVSIDELNTTLTQYSTIEQTAQSINTEVAKVKDDTDTKLERYSTTEQTAELIASTVNTDYVNNLTGLKFVENSVFEQKANEISASVSKLHEDTNGTLTDLDTRITQTAAEITSTLESTYITKVDANSMNEDLQTDIEKVQSNVTSIQTTANGLSTKVSSLTNQYNALDKTVSGLDGSITEIETTASGISSSVSAIENGKFKGKTLFTQSSDRFVFNGNVEIKNGILDSPEISGEEIKLEATNTSGKSAMSITPNSIGFAHANPNQTLLEKFGIVVTDNYIALRLGTGSDGDSNVQSLILEKKENLIRIGTYVSANNFVGIQIEPSSGAFSIPGATAPAVFG